MLFYLTARIVSSVGAFLYPGYASYKTLSQRPASEVELERWLMYWSVLGCLIGVEYLAEWLVSWIPLYYPLKSLFLLYLALPQTRGASYIYTTHLQPFFHSHETQIDAALASLKARAYTFVQERLRALWDAALQQSQGFTNHNQNQNQAPPYDTVAGGPAPPPTLGDPASGPAQLAGTLWRSYGPGIMASGAALFRHVTGADSSTTTTAAAAGAPFTTPPASVFRDANSGSGSVGSTTHSILERRRQLEAELAMLSAEPVPVPMPPANNPGRGSLGSDLGVRERTYSGSGRFEEVEVPSDVEGYDVGEGQGQGHARPGAGGSERGSWFGWASGGGAGKGGYERVKSE